MFRRSALLLLAAGLSISLTGCVLGIDTKEQVTTIPVPHVAGSGIKVTAHNGHIGVKKSAGADIQIIATLRMVSDERLHGTTISANRDSAGVLVIAATPPNDDWKMGEGCAFDISVPEANGVTLKSSNGRIEIAGLTGLASLKTSNGSVTVLSHDGAIDAKTSNGRISVDNATGAVDCNTSNGAVKVSLAGSGPVNIDTSNGAVTLAITKKFTGSIDIKTSNGAITSPATLPGYPSLSVHRDDKRRARVSLGSGPASKIDTSNGSVKIEFAD